jgi:hypothetical protein
MAPTPTNAMAIFTRCGDIIPKTPYGRPSIAQRTKGNITPLGLILPFELIQLIVEILLLFRGGVI